VTTAVVELLTEVVEHWLDGGRSPALQPQVAAYVRGLYGARARALGLVPRPGDSADEVALRATLVRFVGIYGRDPQLLAMAEQRVQRWLERPTADGADDLELAFELAATRGGRPLYERFVAVWRQARVGGEESLARLSLIGLAAFGAPELVLENMQMAMELQAIERNGLLFELAVRPGTSKQVLAFMNDHRERLAAMRDIQLMLATPLLAAPLCSEGELAMAMELARAAPLPADAFARLREHALQRVQGCMARRRLHAASARDFFISSRLVP
jgi:alanyl aminopeptidase